MTATTAATPPDAPTSEQELASAADQLAKADEARDRAVAVATAAARTAAAAGTPILHIAEAIGVTRNTVYRWLDE